jgi:hypothetical protein
MRHLIAIASLFAWCGCATLHDAGYRAQLSSGRIGCMPEEIATSEPKAGIGGGNWVAECRGRRFVCSYETGEHSEVACAPEP